jgi:hypothetical protein
MRGLVYSNDVCTIGVLLAYDTGIPVIHARFVLYNQ